MNKFIRFYNQNRGFIITLIVISALILIIIQTLNEIVKKQKTNNEIAANNVENTIRNEEINTESNVSSITGQTVQNANTKKNIIKNFVEYCNEGKYEEAYNMLTDDCKAKVYPSLEYFKTGYIDRIFYIYRMYPLIF